MERKSNYRRDFDIDNSKEAISVLNELDIDIDEDFLLVKEKFLVREKVFVVLIIKLLRFKI